MGHSVERTAPDTPDGSVGNEGAGASQHLGGRSPCEREQEDAIRRHTFVDEPGHSARERARLARPCTCDDEQWPTIVEDRLALARIEAFEPGRGGTRYNIEHMFAL
jgi:hypothetical protein